MTGLRGQGQALLGRGVTRRPGSSRPIADLTKALEGFDKDRLESGGTREAHLLPVGELVPDVVELASGQLDGQVVGLGPLAERRGADELRPEPLDRPGGEEPAALGRPSLADEQVLADLDAQAAGGPVQPRDVRPSGGRRAWARPGAKGCET